MINRPAQSRAPAAPRGHAGAGGRGGAVAGERRAGGWGVGGQTRASGRGDPAGTDASRRDGGGRGGRSRGSGAGGQRQPRHPRGRAQAGGGGDQRGLRRGPAALLAPGPQKRSPALPALPGRLLPASARRLPARAGALPAPGHPPCTPALHHLRRAAERGAIARPRAAPAQGLHGGVGAGDRLLLPPDRGHRPRLLPRDTGSTQPRGRGPGKRGIQEGPVAGPLQPPLWVVRLHQLGHLCPGDPVPVTGTTSPRATAWAGGSLRLTTGPVWHLLQETGSHKMLSGPRGSVCPSRRDEEPLPTCSQPRELWHGQDKPRPKRCWCRGPLEPALGKEPCRSSSTTDGIRLCCGMLNPGTAG